MSALKTPIAVALLTVAGTVVAADAAFTTPDFRGEANTTYQAWNVFTGTVNQAPDVANDNANGTAILDELTGGAFATSSGNIYSPAVATQFAIDLPAFDTGGDGTSFVLQLRTLGSALDLDSVTVDGVDANTLPGFEYTELDRVALGGFGGDQVDHAFAFNVGNVADSFTLGFGAVSSSLSLDQVSVDTALFTNAVPEPTTGLVVAGTALMALRRRRA